MQFMVSVVAAVRLLFATGDPREKHRRPGCRLGRRTHLAVLARLFKPMLFSAVFRRPAVVQPTLLERDRKTRKKH